LPFFCACATAESLANCESDSSKVDADDDDDLKKSDNESPSLGIVRLAAVVEVGADVLIWDVEEDGPEGADDAEPWFKCLDEDDEDNEDDLDDINLKLNGMRKDKVKD
jgi:hypothetical protein